MRSCPARYWTSQGPQNVGSPGLWVNKEAEQGLSQEDPKAGMEYGGASGWLRETPGPGRPQSGGGGWAGEGRARFGGARKCGHTSTALSFLLSEPRCIIQLPTCPSCPLCPLCPPGLLLTLLPLGTVLSCPSDSADACRSQESTVTRKHMANVCVDRPHNHPEVPQLRIPCPGGRRPTRVREDEERRGPRRKRREGRFPVLDVGSSTSSPVPSFSPHTRLSPAS